MMQMSAGDGRTLGIGCSSQRSAADPFMVYKVLPDLRPTMRRREFITLLAGMAGWPMIARAQQPKALPRVVYLDRQGTPSPWVAGLLSGLREEGYVDGKNISLMRKHYATSTVAAFCWQSKARA